MAVRDADSKTMSVRSAARRLGVHENTIRNWMNSGKLIFEPKPGPSGFRRPLTASVEQMEAQRAVDDSGEGRIRFSVARVTNGLRLHGMCVTAGEQLEYIALDLEQQLVDAAREQGCDISPACIEYQIRATCTATTPNRSTTSWGALKSGPLRR